MQAIIDIYFRNIFVICTWKFFLYIKRRTYGLILLFCFIYQLIQHKIFSSISYWHIKYFPSLIHQLQKQTNAVNFEEIIHYKHLFWFTDIFPIYTSTTFMNFSIDNHSIYCLARTIHIFSEQKIFLSLTASYKTWIEEICYDFVFQLALLLACNTECAY